MITTLDVETTWADFADDNDPSPYLPENRLVCVGFQIEDRKPECFWFYHEQREPDEGAFEGLQYILDPTTLLVGHNVKFDLSWLREAGFTYDGAVYDTMIAEYLLAQGTYRSLKLKDILLERGLTEKATDLIDGYMKEGVMFSQIPADIVEEYNLIDVAATYELYVAQMEEEEFSCR